jgi:membrane associated rhomboid family serine protease
MFPIPIRTDYRMTLTPWVNYALIAANIVLYFLGYNAATPAASQKINAYMLQPYAPELVQFFSCVFLHGSLTHLLGNMVFLWVFGNALNDRLGHAAYLAFYLAGGVLACVGFLVLHGGAPLLGASGAISAVTGAFLVLFPRVRVMMLLWLLYLLMPFEISSLYFLLFQFVFNMLMSLTELGGGGGGGVAYAAHSTGYLFGIGLAALLLATRLLPRDPYDLLSLIRQHDRRQRFRRMTAAGNYDPFGAERLEPGSRRWVQARQVEAPGPDTPEGRHLALRREIAEALSRSDMQAAAARYRELAEGDPDAVLARQNQVDIANYLMSIKEHAAAADAYERFLRHYRDYPYLGDIHLMLGILYGRYLNEGHKAQENLKMAIQSLSDPRKIELARSDLEHLRDAQ